MQSFEVIEEGIEVDLKTGDWVCQFKVLKNLRMQYTHGPNFLSVHFNCNTPWREEARVLVILAQVIVCFVLGADFGHDHVEQTVNDFEV